MSKKPLFTIKLLDDKKPKTETEKIEPKKMAEVQTSEEPSNNNKVGASFKNPNALLVFLGAAIKTKLLKNADVRKLSDQWWIESEIDHEKVCSLIQTTGGKAYAKHEKSWVELSITGKIPEKIRKTKEVSSWPIVDIRDLLSQANYTISRYCGSDSLDVLAPGSLARMIVRRAVALNIETTLIPVIQNPLSGNNENDPDADSFECEFPIYIQNPLSGNNENDPKKSQNRKESNAILLKLKATKKNIIPHSFVDSLCRLPYVIVTDSSHVNKLDLSNLRVDVRCRFPLPIQSVNNIVPQDEIWIISPPDIGHKTLTQIGEPIDASGLTDTKALEIKPIKYPETSSKINKIPVRLVKNSLSHKTPDAILLDQKELENTIRLYLRTRPIDEASFITPGPNVYFLTSPVGLKRDIPFGISLERIGPGNLFLETGFDFYPTLPDSARQELFQLDSESFVVFVKNAAYRFYIKNTVPSWTLWLGETPNIINKIPKETEKLILKLSDKLRESEVKKMETEIKPDKKEVTRINKTDILKQAQKAEMSGDLIKAAGLLESVGYSSRAGKLYEQASTRKK